MQIIIMSNDEMRESKRLYEKSETKKSESEKKETLDFVEGVR